MSTWAAVVRVRAVTAPGSPYARAASARAASPSRDLPRARATAARLRAPSHFQYGSSMADILRAEASASLQASRSIATLKRLVSHHGLPGAMASAFAKEASASSSAPVAARNVPIAEWPAALSGYLRR